MEEAPGAVEAPDEPSTRDRLMDAALEHLRVNGVLGGLNLREVAERAGVTPANIYHLFGSRRALLRAALNREAERQTAPVVAGVTDLPFAQRRLQMFDHLTGRSALELGALLALDDDPDYRPLPFAESTLARYHQQAADGTIPDDVDVLAAHLVTLAVSVGVAIFRVPVARQLDVDTDELTARARAVLARMLEALDNPPGGGSEAGPDQDS